MNAPPKTAPGRQSAHLSRPPGAAAGHGAVLPLPFSAQSTPSHSATASLVRPPHKLTRFSANQAGCPHGKRCLSSSRQHLGNLAAPHPQWCSSKKAAVLKPAHHSGPPDTAAQIKPQLRHSARDADNPRSWHSHVRHRSRSSSQRRTQKPPHGTHASTSTMPAPVMGMIKWCR